MEKLLNQIAQKNPLVNVIIQVQSYGRVFIYDQTGEVVSQENAICIFTKDNTISDRINQGLTDFLAKM